MKGYIYVLLNPLFPKYLKIGQTTRLSEERAKEIFYQARTGIPTEYIVAYDVEVTNCSLVEKHVHKSLEKRRIHQSREFFEISLKEAITIINGVIDALNKQHKIDFAQRFDKELTYNEWWDSLPFTWQQVLRNHLDLSYTPSDIDILRAIHSVIEHSQNEDLRRKVASFIADKKCINKLKSWYKSLDKEYALFNSYLPYTLSQDEIIRAQELKQINCLNQAAIIDLKPLIKFKYLETINFTNTSVNDLAPLQHLINLRQIICNYTDVESFEPIQSLPNLRKITCFETKVTPASIADFKIKAPNCEVEFESFLQHPGLLKKFKS